VSGVAERLIPSVASLRVGRSGGRSSQGSGSGVAITADGFLVTSAHVVTGTSSGSASFSDGGEYEIELVGDVDRMRATMVPGVKRMPVRFGTGS